MADTTQEQFPGDSELAAQAMSAIHAGADPDWVKQMFFVEATKRGADPTKISFNFVNDNPDTEDKPQPTTRATKQAYKDATQGGAPWDLRADLDQTTRPQSVVQGLLASNQVPNSPAGANFDNVQEAGDSTAAIPGWMAAGYGMQSGVRRAASGLLGLASGLESTLDPSNPGNDENMANAQGLLAMSNEDAKSAVGLPGALGQMGASAAGGFLFDPMASSMEKLNAHPDDLMGAELENLKGSAINEVGTAAGLVAKSAPGVAGYLARAGAQGTTNVALTAADKALEGEDLTARDIGMALGAGAFGGLFKEGKGKAKAEERVVPETGDPSFDAGVEHATAAPDQEIHNTAQKARDEDLQAAQEEAFGGKVDTSEEDKTLYQRRKERLAAQAAEANGEPPEVDLDAAMKAAEAKRAAMDTPESVSTEQVPQAEDSSVVHGKADDEMQLPNGDELPYTLAPEGGFYAKDKVKPATDEQLAPFRQDDPAAGMKADVVHNWINKKGNAWDVLTGMRNLPEHLQSVVDKLAANPYAQKILKAVRVTALSADDFKTSTSGLEHSVRPILGIKNGQRISVGHLGAFDIDSNRIVLRGKGFKANAAGRHGLDPVTIVHEVMHGFTKHILDGVESGHIKDPHVVRAARELDAIRQSLKDNADQILRGVDPRTAKEFRYGLTDNHELMSVFYTDSKAKGVLSNITLKGLNAISRIKNAVMDMLGFKSPQDRTMAAQLMDSGDKVLAYNPNKAEAISGLEQVEPRMAASGAKDEEAQPREELQGPRGRIKQFVKDAASSKGIEPKVTLAKRTREGVTALGKAEALQSINRIHSIVTSENKTDVMAALDGDAGALERLGPRAKEVVMNEIKANFDRSLEIVREGMKDPNLDVRKKNILNKILENAGKYQMHITEAREVRGSMARKYELAQTARDKLAANKPLNAREKSAMDSVQIAEKFLADYWMPKESSLPNMSTGRLEELYKHYTGRTADAVFANMPTKEARRTALEAGVQNGLRSITNKTGELNNILKAAMGIGADKNSLRKYYNNVRAPSDIYSTLQNVPKELEQLWNPITEPAARNAASIQAQHNYIANLRAQNQLRETGLGSIFTQDRSTKTHTMQITGEKMGPLQGLWTTEDVHRALDSVFENNSLAAKLLDAMVADNNGTNMLVNLAGKGARGLKAVAAWTKLMSVVGNIGNFVNNFAGSGLQVIASGNVNLLHYARGMKLAAEAIGVGLKKNMSDELKDLFKYHQLEYSHIQELQGTEHGHIIAEAMRRAADSPDPISAWKQAINGVRKGSSLAKELYGAMDFWTKAANWHHNLEFWTKYAERNNTGETLEQIKQKVAERNNDTNITPSLAPKVVRGLEQFGITRFMTYYTEIARTLTNNAAYAFKDLYRSTQNGDIPLFYHGLKRLAGVSTAVGTGAYFSDKFAKGVASAVGLTATQLDDNDPRKKYMDKDAFMSTMQPLVLNDPQHPEAGDYLYDETRPDPFAPVTVPTRHLLEAGYKLANGDKAGAKDLADRAYKEFIGLQNQNAMWSAYARFKSGQQPRLAKENPEAYNAAKKFFTDHGLSVEHANGIMSVVDPLIPASAKNVVYAADDKSPTLKKATEAGVGVQKFNIAEDVSNYLGGKAKDDISKAKAGYMELMKADYKSDPARIEEDFKQALKDANDPYEQLKTAVQAARLQGASRSEMIRRLKAADVPTDITAAILHNKPVTPKMIDGNLKKDFQRDVINTMPDGEKKQEAKDRYKYNTKLMHQLMKKYKNVSIEDID